jgi:hypothetical protein
MGERNRDGIKIIMRRFVVLWVVGLMPIVGCGSGVESDGDGPAHPALVLEEGAARAVPRHSRSTKAMPSEEDDSSEDSGASLDDRRRDESDPRLRRYEDPSASAERVNQVAKLDASGDDLAALLDALATDPDPAVRVAAADLLAESERSEAIDGLLGALTDPSPEVVIQALQTLAVVGDADIIPWIEPLLENPNPDIRGPAEETIYFVESPEVDETGVVGSGAPPQFGNGSDSAPNFESWGEREP